MTGAAGVAVRDDSCERQSTDRVARTSRMRSWASVVSSSKSRARTTAGGRRTR